MVLVCHVILQDHRFSNFMDGSRSKEGTIMPSLIVIEIVVLVMK